MQGRGVVAESWKTELPGGARQSEADRELTLEQPAEDPQGCVGSDGIPAVERGKAC